MSLLGLLRQPAENKSTNDSGRLEGVSSQLCQDPCAEQMLRSGQYCKLLCDPRSEAWELDALQVATQLLEREMAMVPSASTTVLPVSCSDASFESLCPEDIEPTTVDAFFVDRQTVTNAQFERFVNSGGYRQEEYWPEDILPLVFQFVDQTAKAGPSGWRDGHPSQDLRDHPVVGICWYEANACALWAGKQLPTSAQWQLAGTWWKPLVRYPWGNGFEPHRANIAIAGNSGTVSSASYNEGDTPNGIQQLIGNVWEWVYASIEQVDDDAELFPLVKPLGEIRGGAFDTYLPSQATCLFRSGQPLLHRASNLGFRCCVSASALQFEYVDES